MQIVLDSVSGSEKLKLVKELGTIRRHLPTVAGVNKLTLVKRVRDIRQLLSVDGGSESVNLTIDPRDIESTAKSLADYLESISDHVPLSLHGYDMLAIKEAWSLVYRGMSNEKKSEYASYADRILGFNTSNGNPESAFEHFKSAGNIFDYDAEKIKTITDEIKNISSMSPSDSPEVVEKMNQLHEEYGKVRDAINDAFKVNQENGYSQEEIEKASDMLFEELAVKKNQILDQLKKLDRKKFEDKLNRIEELKSQIAPVGEGLINSLIGASKVTQERADSWANAQTITKSALSRLNRVGYKESDIRRDMAEFYRVTGGKLRQIIIDNDGSKRANARGIGDAENTVIYPDSRFDKKVLWHEMAHHLEVDPSAKAASNGFLIKRRESNKRYSLRSLTGNNGYRKNEAAYKDDFINPYIGKIYSDQTTEVWSMGIQYLSNPQDAALMLGKDPEMAALIAGYLQSDLTPGLKALHAAQNIVKDNAQARRDDKDAQYEDAIKKLSDGVEIIDDGWVDALPEFDKESLFDRSLGAKSNAKFVGSWHDFRVFSGKFRNIVTRRVSKGYRIIYVPGNALVNQDGKRFIPYGGAFHLEMSEIKAAMRMAEELFLYDIARVSYSIFASIAYKETVIEYADKLAWSES
jgi:hypothetical protein